MFELLPLAVGVVLAQVSPGPNLMAVSANALGAGRAAGIATAAGVATGVFVWAVLFAFGVGAIIAALPSVLVVIKLLGGAYLTFLGLRALRTAFSARAQVLSTGPFLGVGRAYATGLAVVLTNPKAALMWVAVSAYVATSGLSPFGFLMIGFCAATSAMVIYGAYALVFSAGRVRRLYGRGYRWVEVGFGAIFGALGTRLLFDGPRELRAP